ncbi:MAG TPA: M20/M25/M40 family metallo-hydrolase [Gemmatimonadales bacterium]|nr:M20/M25/M40 family metallo-hydrolase [Gemmatimonadales bacterium]
MRRMLLCAAALGVSPALAAQTFPTDDPVLKAMWNEGMRNSQAMTLLQVLSDSIGPRLTGTPNSLRGQEWITGIYSRWGIPARSERYGTWAGWRRGPSHIDLMAPRVRSLQGTMLAWSPGTKGRPVQGGTVILADPGDSVAFAAWLPNVKGKFVLASMPQISCRPDSSYRQWAGADAYAALVQERAALIAAWPARRGLGFGVASKALAKRLEDAGALGAITSTWTGGWGATRIFQAQTRTVPTVALSCEDYGLVFRLTERNQGPVVRVTAESEALGEIPVFNVIAEIRGSEKPGEYVMLSAHFDSWDGASGTTDNGTGTIIMLEAMRILKAAYPRPKRTILVGHWNSEENGLVGSRAFAEDHPEIVRGLQALFNQDNGTGRIASVGAAGLTGAGSHLAAWASRLPSELSSGISFSFPGTPAGGGSDNAAFACYGAPGFGLGSEGADYGSYTWHTGLDTFDKAIAANLRRNATLTAMLAYLASEDPVTVPRDQRVMAPTSSGEPRPWPACTKPARSSAESIR